MRKCTTDGKVVLTIGTPKKPAPAFSGDPFNRCTHTALSPQGDIYVSDGYQCARSQVFARRQTAVLLGRAGNRPGQFNLVHNIACDDEGWVYVADRENHRVQVFDGNGKYETQWHNLMRPCGLFVTRGKEPIAVIGELGPETVASLTKGVPNLGPRVSVVSAKGEMLAHLGTRAARRGTGPVHRAARHRGRFPRRHLRGRSRQHLLASPVWQETGPRAAVAAKTGPDELNRATGSDRLPAGDFW